MMLERLEFAVRFGYEAEFETALVEVRQRVFMSPGFRGFAVAQGVDLPSTYLVQVHWETLEELSAFTDSGRFEKCWAPVEPFLAGPPRVDHFSERPTLALHGPGVITDLSWLS